MNYYTTTFRKCSPIKKDEELVRKLCYRYLGYLTYLKTKYPKMHAKYHFEAPELKNGKLNVHIHIVMKSINKVYTTKQKGWSVDHQQTRNKYAWKSYSSKDKNDTVDKLIQSLFECEFSNSSETLIEDFILPETFDIRKIAS